MHRSFIISEEERKRILGIHQKATKSQYLIIKEATDPYEPSEEDKKYDAQNAFKTVPCITKTKWLRGVDNGDDVYYISKAGSPFRYYGEWLDSETNKMQKPTIFKKTDDEFQNIREWSCRERTFTPAAQSTSEIATGKRTLAKGDKNSVVTVLNNALIKAGKLSSDKADSDVFDDKTKQAVIAFQQENVDSEGKKLRPDGVVGKRTWWALENTGAASSGVSDIAVEKSAQRVFGKELENIKKSSPLFTQDFTKSNADKMANIKGDTTNQETKKEDGVAKGEQPIAKTPTTSADMQEFR